MTRWEDVIKTPAFQDLDPEDQVQIRAEWYDTNVTPKYVEAGLSEDEYAPIRQKDILEFDNGQGYVSSFANSVARGALGTVSSAIQGVGALTQDPEIESAGTAMQEGVESTFGVNPSMTKTNFAGEVVGNVGSMIATGGAGGLIGKGLGVAARGAEVGSLGTGFLAGAGQGAQEADQYGITGEDRVARAFLGGAAEVVSEKIPGLGMGTELRAISKIPGLSEVAGQRAGGFVKAVGSEAGEEVISQGIGNLSTNALVAPGVQGPDLTEGFGEAAIGGALGGGIMGGIGLIGQAPSERALAIAEQRNDPGAKAALEEARKLVPIIAPEIAPPVEGDTTALDPYEPDLEKFAAENPVLPFAEPATPGLVPGAAESGMDAGAAAPGLESGTAAPGLVTESPASGLDTGAAEPAAPVEVAPAGPTEAAVPEVLTAQAEAALPTPEVTEEQLREEERLIDPKGRITEETGVKMAEALKTLGVSTVDVIFNDTGKPPNSTIPQQTRGGRYTVDGKEQVYLNRNLITKDTPVHEIVGHGVIERLGDLMPDLDAQARAILTGSPLEAAIKARYDREGIQLDPEALFREAKATLIGNQGADVFEAYANNGEFVRALKEWWAKFREWMDGFLASKGIDPNMPLEQFAKKVNRLILAGKLRDVTTNVQQEENRQENDQGQKLLAFSESLLESLPERARAAWSPEDLAAADRFAETGDRSALSEMTLVKRKRTMEHRENLRKPLGPQFSLKPSGLAANQPGTKVRAMAAAYTYQTESAGPAFDQAEKLYNQGGTFEQQLSQLNDLIASSGTNGILNMTPGSYWGLMVRDLTAMRDNPDAPESERQQAERSLDRLMSTMTEVAAAQGQFVKGFDFGLKIGNSPAMQVRAADKLVPFDGSPEKRKEFDNGANVITTELDSLNQEALTTAPEAAVEAKIGQGVADVIRGQDAADAGAVQLDIAAEQIDEQAMPDWYLNAISQADVSVRTTVEALMEEFMLASLLEAEGDFSLTPGQEANKAIRERALARLAAIRASGTSKATALAESKKRQAELARKLAVKPKAPTPSAPADESDVMAMAVDRAVRLLTQLTSPAAKPKQASTNKLIAKAVTDSIFAKIGLVPPPAGTADSMATTVGLLLANQDIAASLVQDTMARIQQDSAIAGLITLPKLKAFFQATIGKEFTTVDGTTTSSAPYGEKQIADLLRAELKAAEVSLNKVVMDAALQRQTADQLEAQLRDPKRSFTKVLSPEAIDRMVAAVRAEFERTARQRADRLAREQAEESVRDAMAAEAKAIRKDESYRARLRRDARRKAFRAARRKGLVVPLEADEIKALKAQPNDKIVDYLAREFGFNVADVAAIPREADRYATLEAMTLKLADTLGLDKQQSEALLKPVIAEAMKTVDAKRKAQVKKKIEDAVKRLGVKTKKDIPTEAQKLIRLAELGGLSAENVEVLLLDTLGAEKFSKEFKDFLVDLITKANDPNLPQASRDQFTAAYLNAIRSARGVSAVGLAGEWVMSNIFMSLNTFKVNALWGFVKSVADSAVFVARFDPGNVAPGAQLPKGARQALVRQMLRGYNSDLRYQSKYILKTGMSKLESDFTTQFSNSDFELLAQFPDTEIRAWLNGKPISKPWATMAKKMAAFSKWTRRIMVATDIVNRTPAYEMLKANAIIKFIAERGTNVPTNAREWQKAIDDALYGGDFKAARDEAWKEVESAIADGRVAKQERGIYFGEVMDRMLAKNLGLSEVQLNELLARAQESAKRWTVANATEGILGGLSNAMLAMVRDVPGLKFLLPAIRMPIGAFSQGLDWSPYGFLRYRAIKSSGFRTASYSNIVFNKSGKRNWNQPAAGIPEEQAIDTLNKAFLGSAMMLAMAVAAAASFDDDEDEADFYITGKGPEDPQKNRLWRDKGNKPFMVRIGGFSFNYQESPMYPMLTTLGAWSDSHRYGKPEDTESDRLLYAFSKSIAGFGDAAVLKSFQDALAAVSGGSGYTAASASENTAKTFGRLASVVVAPRVGNEINTILYGPQDQKEGGWAARMLANVPFVPAVLDYPALNWFGEEITVQRGGPAGELLTLMSHRVSPQLTDDPQMRFVARIGANKLTTTRRTLDGVEVMDQPALVRQWAQTSGAAIRQWLTPERMAQFEAMRQKDVKTAEEAFDKEVRRIREEALRRVPGVVF